METAEISVQPALDRMSERAAECYIPRQHEVTVQVVVTGAAREVRTFRMGEAFDAIDPVASGIDATITLGADTLEAILASPSMFDPRVAVFTGRVGVTGESFAAHHLLQLLTRPDPRLVERFAHARSVAPDDLAAIEETDALDANQVLDALEASRPLCLRGVLDWPALAWSLDELAARHGNVPLRICGATGREETLGEFIARLQDAAAADASAPYTDGCLLPLALEALFPFPLFPSEAFSPPKIWAGARRVDDPVTRLHCDNSASFLAQVTGRKKVRLYSPAQHTLLYPIETFNAYQPCRVDVARPDFDRFPLLAAARPLDIEIGPGDLLIVPTGWYHCVWALDDVLSVARFLDDDVRRLLDMARMVASRSAMR